MPKVFGIEHFLYLFVMISLLVGTIVIEKKLLHTDKQKTVLIKIMAGLLLICIIWNRIAIAYYANNYWLLLPDSFCGTSSLVLACATLIGKKNNDVLHCVCYFGFIGGLITLVYPDFIGQADSIFFSKTMSGLLHHTLMVFLIIVMVETKYFIPTIKKWKTTIFGGGYYIVYGLFLITALGFDKAMEITEPILSGTPFYWYTMGGIFIVIYFTGMIIYETIKRKISN